MQHALEAAPLLAVAVCRVAVLGLQEFKRVLAIELDRSELHLSRIVLILDEAVGEDLLLISEIILLPIKDL